jgi:hypothetical protein
MSTNLGGVAIVASPGTLLLPYVIAVSPTTFEFTAAWLVHGLFSAVVVDIYRPGSHVVQAAFFDELSADMNLVATLQERVFLVGDVNIRYDRPNEPTTRQFLDLIAGYGFSIQPIDTTHKSGGTIDVVINQLDLVSIGQMSVVDVGLSDHHMLSWSVPAARVVPTAEHVTRRPWRQLDVEILRREISGSTLCQRDLWPTDIDLMAELFDSEINSIFDRLVPYPQVIRQRRSDVWFVSD